MPPRMATTVVPSASRPLGSSTTVPAHSMPVTLATSPKFPLRMYASAWFSPNASTAMSTSPAAGIGSGSSVTVSTSGPPKVLMVIAFISSISFLSDRSSIWVKKRPPGGGRCRLLQGSEGVVNDDPQHLLVRVGLADDHQAGRRSDQALGERGHVG